MGSLVMNNLVFLLLPLASTIQAQETHHVTIGVYYESLCPNSRYFITEQFYPNWELFGNNKIKIDLKPFGKANFTEAEDRWTFMCQHGPEECYGNLVQACVLNQVPAPQEYVPLINCIMASDFPPEAAGSCLEILGITTTSTERILQCAESEEGSNLLHDIGLETGSLSPSLTGVPWLLFNDEFDRDNWIQGMNDLQGLLCQKFLSDSSECNK